MPCNVSIFDGCIDILVKYLDVRAKRLERAGKKVEVMFSPLNCKNDYYVHQSFGHLKKCLEGAFARISRSARDTGTLIRDISIRATTCSMCPTP